MSFKEGLTVFHPEPKPPQVPYPEPAKVSDPLHLHKSRLKSLFQILGKHMELANTILIALSKARDMQTRQLLEANYRHEIKEMDETWREIKMEITAMDELWTEIIIARKTALKR